MEDKPHELYSIRALDEPNKFLIDGDLCTIATDNGIVQIQNGTVGLGFSAHPNIDSTGSVDGMVALGHWGKWDRIQPAHGFIYNKSRLSINHKLDLMAYMIEIGKFDPRQLITSGDGSITMYYPPKRTNFA